jgi:cytoskeleton protein RodZ
MSAEWAEQPTVPGSEGVPGKVLAAQREAMGWTVEQVADQLKLAVRQVIALEAGDYASLPSAAVVRGFVRAYAKVVKLDPVPLVAQIALDAPAPSDATATTVRRDKPASFSEVRFPTNGKRTPLPLGLIVSAVVLGVAAVGAWQFGLIPGSLLHSGSPAAGSPAASSPAANTGAASGAQGNVTLLPPSVVADTARKSADGQMETTVVKTDQELKSLQDTSVPLISVPPPTMVSAGAPAAGSPAGVAPTPAGVGPAAAAPASANALVIAVREDSWIEVRRAKGAPLLSRLVKGGSTETVDVTEPVTLIVGKPGAVEATLRGAAVALPPVAGSTVSRVNLK